MRLMRYLGKVNSWGGFWAIQKKGSNWQNISLKHIPIIYPKHFNKKLLLMQQTILMI